MRQDGHHRGHQRAAGAQGRADAAGDHARFPRRAAHRLPEPPAPVRPAHRAAGAAVHGSDRSAGAHRRPRRGDRSAGCGAPRRGAAGVARAGPRQRGHRLHARLSVPRARARGRSARAGRGLHAGQRQPQGKPDDEVRQPRRHHGGRRIPVADPAPLRRAGRGRDARREALLHAVVRGIGRRACVPGQGRDPERARGRHRRHGAHRAARRTGQGDRLRHGRHVDRRQPLRRRVRARVRDAGGRRAHARADDEHPHRGRGRRVDPAVRRRALSRRPPERGRQPGTGLLPARRTAHRDRRQRHAGQGAAGVVPAAVRAARRREPRCGRRAREVRRACAADGPQRRGGRGRLRRHRGGADGQRDQEDLGRPRLRRHALHAAVLRRRRRPACLPGRRCARHDARVRAPARRRALGLRHGPRRPERDARARDRAPARRRRARGRRRRARHAGGRRRGRPRAPAGRQRHGHHAAARARALRRHRHRADRRLRRARRGPGRVRAGLPAALRVPDAGQGDRRRGGLGGSDPSRRFAAGAAAGDARAAPGASPRDGARVLGRRVARRRARGPGRPARRRRDPRPGDHRRAQRYHRRRAGMGGGADGARPPPARATHRARGPLRGRHPRRPRAARGVQQPVHEHRRADGAAAAQHRLLGQHQGAAGFQLRAVRRRRQPDRERARTCRCTWARWARASGR